MLLFFLLASFSMVCGFCPSKRLLYNGFDSPSSPLTSRVRGTLTTFNSKVSEADEFRSLGGWPLQHSSSFSITMRILFRGIGGEEKCVFPLLVKMSPDAITSANLNLLASSSHFFLFRVCKGYSRFSIVFGNAANSLIRQDSGGLLTSIQFEEVSPRWVFVAMVYDATPGARQLVLYQDFESRTVAVNETAAMNLPMPDPSLAGEILLGGLSGRAANAAFDDVSVWNGTLTPDEVVEVQQGACLSYTLSNCPRLPVVWFPLRNGDASARVAAWLQVTGVTTAANGTEFVAAQFPAVTEPLPFTVVFDFQVASSAPSSAPVTDALVARMVDRTDVFNGDKAFDVRLTASTLSYLVSSAALAQLDPTTQLEGNFSRWSTQSPQWQLFDVSVEPGAQWTQLAFVFSNRTAALGGTGSGMHFFVNGLRAASFDSVLPGLQEPLFALGQASGPLRFRDYMVFDRELLDVELRALAGGCIYQTPSPTPQPTGVPTARPTTAKTTLAPTPAPTNSTTGTTVMSSNEAEGTTQYVASGGQQDNQQMSGPAGLQLPLPLPVLIGIGGGGLFLILIFIGLCVCSTRRRRRHSRRGHWSATQTPDLVVSGSGSGGSSGSGQTRSRRNSASRSRTTSSAGGRRSRRRSRNYQGGGVDLGETHYASMPTRKLEADAGSMLLTVPDGHSAASLPPPFPGTATGSNYTNLSADFSGHSGASLPPPIPGSATGSNYSNMSADPLPDNHYANMPAIAMEAHNNQNNQYAAANTAPMLNAAIRTASIPPPIL